MSRIPIVRRLLLLLAASSMLGVAFLTATPGVLGVASAPCTNVSLDSSPHQVAALGDPVTLSAFVGPCSVPEFQFYLQAPGGLWVAQGSYAASNNFNWTTTGLKAGIWGIGVHARQTGSGVAYQTYWLGSFNLVVAYCQSATISAGMAPPQPPGTGVTFTASAVPCGIAQYRFIALPPGGKTWTVLRAYGASSTYAWDTTGLKPGIWQIGVWVREQGSAASYDAYALTTYMLSRPQKCFDVFTDDSTSSPAPSGTVITVTGSAGPCDTPQYEFWVLAPGGVWTIAQPYGASATFAWDTTGLAAGQYEIGTWARQLGSTSSYDTYVTETYDLL